MLVIDATNRAEVLRKRQEDKFILDNIGLARKAAHDIKSICHLSYEELEQVAVLHLVAIARRYDPSKGTKPSTFILPTIKNRLLNYLRDKGTPIKVPRKFFDVAQASRRTERKLTKSLGRVPKSTEVAFAMGKTLVEINEAKTALYKCKHTVTEEGARNLSTRTKESVQMTYKGDWSSCTLEQQALLNKYFNGKAKLSPDLVLAMQTCLDSTKAISEVQAIAPSPSKFEPQI